MSKKIDTISIFSAKQVELITDESSGFAFASISKNPNITWVKFVLLDDKPNANKHRVPIEEFDNVIRTGLFMPLKMGNAEEEKKHEFSKPLGVITHLIKNDNLIEAIAALWNTERKEDVHSIKERFKAGKDINLSWELHFSDAQEEEDGVIALKNIAMNAATIVDIPAYGGRTSVTALAERSTEGETMETIEKTKHEEIVSQLNNDLESVKAERSDLEVQLTNLQEEVEQLRAYRDEVEAEKQKVEKLNSIKTRFSEAGLELEEAFYSDREEFLMNLKDSELDFYIQDMVAFAGKSEKPEAEEEADTSTASFGTNLPNLDKTSKNNKEYQSVLDYIKSR